MNKGEDDLLGLLQTYISEGRIPAAAGDRLLLLLTERSLLPDSHDSLLWKEAGNAFFKQKDYETALKCYEYSVETDHTNTDALHNIAMTYKITGRNADAQAVLDYLASLRPATGADGNTAGTSTPSVNGTPDSRDPVQSAGRYEAKEGKNPVLAAILSFFFGGLGQVYNGNLIKGLAIFFGEIAGVLLLFIPTLIIKIYAVYDAYTTSKRMNIGQVPFIAVKSRDLIVYFVVIIITFVVVVALMVALIALFPLSSPLPAAAGAGGPQFVNPGFETGSLDGWASGSRTSVLGDRSHTGKYSCHFDMSGTPASDYLNQNIDLTGISGISFWGMGESNNWPFAVYIDGKLVQQYDAVPNSWTKYTVPVSGHPGIHSFSVRWNGGPGMYGADVDDFSLS